MTGSSSTTLVDRLTVTLTRGHAQDAYVRGGRRQAGRHGRAALLPPATAGTAITGIGGEARLRQHRHVDITADRTGLSALRVRCADAGQAETTHCLPGPAGRR
ncbi:hypothetical protein NFX46_23530 [Streptomyces phaeoluteigriseus]|uniref:Uncharacterized protein n=1 Tax=Streptomyces phaeoluteigriseus TaxID=114686 RepID=A0ABY4ZBK2_9ACTN|nr:hypothetical protein [Streptomyces phaeoluteigriseus]USQ86414.1 hypothetical protein NFX46_23530 [Streptomyces phaeoluteigriseus]